MPMYRLLLVLLLCLSLPCRAETPPQPFATARFIHPQVRVPGLESRVFTAEHWWEQVLPLLGADRGFAVETIGHSAEGRPLRHIRWGQGPVHVLMWSQMHGDESTATMALADLIAWLGDGDDGDGSKAHLARTLTLHLVPILNPDGAARFQRHNAQGIDLNRDAAALVSPEARALKALRDRLRPDFGFNLHDQRPGYRVGDSDRQTAIALLAPPADAAASLTPARVRAIGVAARIAEVLAPWLPGRLARWDETFNPRAFGDLMQQWGTSTVLVEAGGIEGDPQKQQLRRYTFMALLAGLGAINGGPHAYGSHADADPSLYHRLPENGKVWDDLLLEGATVHVAGNPPVTADVLVNFRHPLSFEQGRIVDIGQLDGRPVRRRVAAHGLHLHALPDASLHIDQPARLALSRDPAGREVVWTLDGSLPADQLDPQPLPATDRQR